MMLDFRYCTRHSEIDRMVIRKIKDLAYESNDETVRKIRALIDEGESGHRQLVDRESEAYEDLP